MARAAAVLSRIGVDGTSVVTDPMRVAVFVGTDHHPFDRLVSTIDSWVDTVGVETEVMIQHGTSAPPAHAYGRPLVGHDDVMRLMQEADVVACHGGPATIADARKTGHRPLVMPRDPKRGEHVDSHQMLFATRLARAGLIELAQDEEALLASLNAALRDSRRTTRHVHSLPEVPLGGQEIQANVAKIGRLADALLDSAPPRRQAVLSALGFLREPSNA